VQRVEHALPYSQACENNKQHILEVLRRYLSKPSSLLEIGGGSGQHAVFFAEKLAQVSWQSSDRPDNVDNLNLRIRQAQLPNLPDAIPLDVDRQPWKLPRCEAIFSANCLHIIGETSCVNFFAGVGQQLRSSGLLLIYGPFRYGGAYTSASNADFDRWLKRRNPASGIRDFEWIDSLAREQGLRLVEDQPMPANNQMLVWRKGE
jgi:cyclopropane fatty-acyl-phospholipid synthase-like methyltransferase